MAHPTPVDLIILSGFLGSGKTTLLVDFLQQEGLRDTGVIVNEVGEIGVDGAIVADGASSVPMTLLANGCVCCSLRSDLVYTVSALLDAPRPAGYGPLRRIILETSGLSRPGPIIASLADPELAGRGLRINVVTTYDCQSGALRAEQFDEAAAQFAAAHRIVLTKTDTVAPETMAQHRDRAAAINPLAHILADAERAAVVKAVFTDLPRSDAADLAIHALRASSRAALRHPRIHVLSGMLKQATEWTEFSEWLDDLAGLCGDRLLRMKAMIRVSDCDEPILIQSVGTTFGAPRRMMSVGAAEDVIILITRDIGLEDIQTNMAHAPVTLSLLG